MGQPSKIDAQVGTDAEGNPITVADRIVNAMRAGAYLEESALAAGVVKDTVYEWRNVAGRARIRARGDLTAIELTDHERKCIAFSDAVEEARAQWEINTLATLERESRGGQPVTITTTRTLADGSIETTVRTETTRPNVAVALWRLERTMPHKYGRRVEVTGRDGEPLMQHADRVESLVETFRAFKAGQIEERQAKAVTPRRKRAHRNGDDPAPAPSVPRGNGEVATPRRARKRRPEE